MGSGLSHWFLSDRPVPLTEPYQKLDTSQALVKGGVLTTNAHRV